MNWTTFNADCGPILVAWCQGWGELYQHYVATACAHFRVTDQRVVTEVERVVALHAVELAARDAATHQRWLRQNL